jgi:hypothetical protein
MLTNVKEYLKLPLDAHPLTCPECDNSLLDSGAVIVWKMASSLGEFVLCRKCAERVGFALWTDALRPEVADDSD